MIRPYTIGDRTQLIDLLRLNTPKYFDSSEEDDFIEYLNKYADNYFVVEENESIVGCGGYNYADDISIARISWDIVHPDFHGKGIGTKLTGYRIEEIKNSSSVILISVRTTQLVYKFYEKMGFTIDKIEENFWARGFDLYQMKMPLNKKRHRP